jgi:hypothetical protein
MKMLGEIAAELAAMFVGDARLSITILAVIALAAAIIAIGGVDPLVGGAVLLVGSLSALVENVRHSAR